MLRPFVTRLNPVASPGEVRVELGLKVPPSSEQAAALDAVWGTLVAAAWAGALCGVRIDPRDSALTPVPPVLTGTRLEWSFSDVRASPGLLTILLNIFHSLHEEIIPLASVGIKWNEIARLNDPLAIRFPGMTSPSFLVQIDDVEESAFQIQVRFPETVSSETVEKIIAVMGEWFSLASLGAYAPEGMSPSDSRILFADAVDEVSPGTIVWYIDKFYCDDSAFAGLINVLARAHHLIAPILSVEIGDEV
jgi:hypothetical protein